MVGLVIYAIGLDLGGTNVKALAITPKGRLLGSAVAHHGGRRGWASVVRDTVAELSGRMAVAPACVGVAAPGLPSGDGNSIAIMPGRLRGLEGLHWGKFLRIRAEAEGFRSDTTQTTSPIASTTSVRCCQSAVPGRCSEQAEVSNAYPRSPVSSVTPFLSSLCTRITSGPARSVVSSIFRTTKSP